ncbi:hypothetical protein Cpir12675_003945 [Ceratocystis pirilliformis]|uniref:Only prolin and serin are matching in the corresponding protein n=1 Tax=Ceratocystis pirilliformis TaxID=259994 RepID=A0ABR3YZK3_9PEZI
MPPHLKPLLLPQLVAERDLSPTTSISTSTVNTSATAITAKPQELCVRDSFDAFEFDSYPLSSSVSTASNLSHSVLSSFHQQQLPLFLPEPDVGSVFHTRNSSASDLASPATPSLTMSCHNPSHMRNTSAPYPTEHGSYAPGYAPLNSVTSTMVIDFTQSMHLPMEPLQQSQSKSATKRQLPDVMEEPYEREERSRSSYASSASESYENYCLGTSCSHSSVCQDCCPSVHGVYSIDYDSVLSDNEYASTNKMRDNKDGIVSIAGSRFPNMSGWRSARNQRRPTQTSLFSTDSIASNYPLVNSSCYSSTATPPRPAFHGMGSSTPASPATSFCDSHESVLMSPNHCPPTAVLASKGIEKDRSQALTPLLPPLKVEGLNKPRYAPSMQSPFHSPFHSPLQSPLHSPPTSPSINEQFHSTAKHQSVAPSHKSGHSLSTRPSISSFLPSPTTEIPHLFANIMQEQEQDQWSDSLGHANFTIFPAPYQPEAATVQSLQKLRDDWQLARADYVKHILRTGENYGETSKVYQLTKEKWDFIQSEWSKNHTELMKRVAAATSPATVARTSAVPIAVPSSQSIASRYTLLSKTRSHSKDGTQSGLWGDNNGGLLSVQSLPVTVTGLPLEGSSTKCKNTSVKSHGSNLSQELICDSQWPSREGTINTVVPHLIDGTGKFPYRGDEDIVGPMVRDAVMIRNGSEERKAGHFNFLRNIIDKVKK